MADDVGPIDGADDEQCSEGELVGDPEEDQGGRRQPSSESEGNDERNTDDRGRYIPTPEELEVGETPEAPRGLSEEQPAEKPAGLFERFRMRRRWGVGRRRKYVTPGEVQDRDGSDAAGSDGPEFTPERDGDEQQPGDEVHGATSPASPDAETDEQDEKVREDEPEKIRGEAEIVREDNKEPDDDVDSSSDNSKPTPRKVGSVSFEKAKKRKPAAKKQPTDAAKRKPRSQRDVRLAELHQKAKAHGHSMGKPSRRAGKDDLVFRCTRCDLRATLVADQEEWATTIYWGIRGPALERRCTVES